jgi:PAS domain S-box-containing protein
MANWPRIPAANYLKALLAVAAATSLNLLLFSWAPSAISPLFFTAVIAGAYFGGLGPGLLGAAVAVTIVQLLSRDFEHQTFVERAIRILCFFGTAAFISWIVTDRRRVEAEERARRVWYEAMLTSVGDGVIATDADGTVSFLNTAGERLTGWSRAEALGRPITEVFPFASGPEEHPAKSAIRRIAPADTGQSTLLIDRTGRRRPISLRADPIRSDGSKPAGAVLVFEDASDRRRAEEAAAELAAIVASSRDAIICRGVDDRITTWNPGAERLFGYTAAEALGQPISILLPADQSDEMPRMLSRIEGGAPVSHYETERAAKDGRRIDVSVSVSPLRNRSGRIVGLATIARDVTERRQAERRQAAQYAIGRLLAEAATVEQALPRVLEVLCGNLRWDLGLFWLVDRGSRVLRRAAAWHRGDARFEPFVAAMEELTFVPGVGLPGATWLSGEPDWVVEIGEEPQLTRGPLASRCGLCSVVAVPLRHGEVVLGVVELYAADARQPDEALFDTFRIVGGQVGLFLERKRAEVELKVAETRFRRLAEAGILGIIVTDIETHLVSEANDAFLLMIGASRDDLDAGRIDWLAMTPPEYHEVDARAIAQIRATGACEPFAKEYEGLNGRRVSVILGAAILDSPTRVIAFLLDVTERRRTEDALRHREQQLRLALDVARMGTWDRNLVTGEVEWSENLALIHGLPPGSDGVALESFAERVHPDDADTLRVTLEQAIADASEFEIEFRVEPPEGSTLWLSSRGRVFRDATGQPARMVGVAIDVTGRKQAEEELKAAKEAADAANEAKNEFLAVLSHELRTPLTPVLAAVSAMIDDDSTPSDFRPILQMVRRNVELESRLIDDLLDVTRISRGKLQFETQVIDAHELIYQALDICMGDLVDKDLRRQLTLDATQHHVVADPARLQQVFWNLIKNAVKFTPMRGLLMIRSANEGGNLIVEVSDTGLGIDPDALPKIFNAFEQGNASITRRFGGLGLGLAISRSVVELLGGKLTAVSEGLDQGSTFRIELPIVKLEPGPLPSETNGLEPRKLDKDRKSPSEGAQTPLHILLVEDSKDSLDVLTRLLRRRGHKVAPARCVAEALEVAGSDSFDLLISDLGLPDGSGIDVIQGFRVHTDAPAIVLSGFGMESDLRRTREAGFAMHLIKPVDLAQLEAAIRSVVAASEARGSSTR